MSDVTDRASAYAQLEGLAALDTVPVIGVDDLDSILTRCKRASTWVTAIAYVPGDVVLPTTRNGHRYVCVTGGTSGTTDPFTSPPRTGAKITEGTSSPLLTWIEAGPEYKNIYDVRQAAYEVWDLKCRLASQFIQTGDLHMEMVYDHCVKVRDGLTPMGFA